MRYTIFLSAWLGCLSVKGEIFGRIHLFILNALTTYCSLALTNTNTPHFIFYGVFYHAVLSMGMWVIHKLNDSIEECKAGDSSQYESIDKAAAFWIGSVSADDNGGILYELAEQLGEHILHKEGDRLN